MAEYKNGFNAFGGIPVDSSRLSSDVQTGRAVYVNEDEYSDEPDYKNRVDQTVNEGYHREAPFEAPEIIVPEPIIPSGTKNISENGTYDVRQFAEAEVNVAGGGSSDFSTAEVTLTNIDSETDYIDDLLITLIIDELLSPTISPSTGVATTPLYKGECTAVYMGDTSNISVSGNATYDDGIITITGDCTITIDAGGAA